MSRRLDRLLAGGRAESLIKDRFKSRLKDRFKSRLTTFKKTTINHEVTS